MTDADPLLFGPQMGRGRFAAVGRAHVVEDDLLELLGDSLALERHGLLAIDVTRERRVPRPFPEG